MMTDTWAIHVDYCHTPYTWKLERPTCHWWGDEVEGCEGAHLFANEDECKDMAKRMNAEKDTLEHQKKTKFYVVYTAMIYPPRLLRSNKNV